MSISHPCVHCRLQPENGPLQAQEAADNLIPPDGARDDAGPPQQAPVQPAPRPPKGNRKPEKAEKFPKGQKKRQRYENSSQPIHHKPNSLVLLIPDHLL